jgi:hypothetical protein
MENRTIDRNFIAYIRDVQSGNLSSGQHVVYKHGKAIASGSKESMESLCKFYDSTDEKESVLHVQADLSFANSQSIEELEKEWLKLMNLVA